MLECGSAVRHPASPALGIGKIIGVIRTHKPAGVEVRYMAYFGREPDGRAIIRMGDVGDFAVVVGKDRSNP
jgi:hypothetical protein